MKRALLVASFFLVLSVALAALYYTQRHNKQAPVSPNAVLELAADAQRDLTRVPMHFTRLSDEEEIAIGKTLAAHYPPPRQELSPEQQGTAAYVSLLGARLAAQAQRQLPYRFHVIWDRNMINAFSLPGGPVYIGEGLLELMTTEDELASVLAHELEHIDHYHCVERVQVAGNLKNLNLGVLGELLELPFSLWEAGYQKDEELEADREGIFLAVQAGYSPYGAVEALNRLAKLGDEYVTHAQAPEDELSDLAMQSLQGYFRSHPLPSERLAQANQIIAQQHWETRKEQKPFHVEYTVHNGQFVK
jgi:beta-barrel assembly-enhancing protease